MPRVIYINSCFTYYYLSLPLSTIFAVEISDARFSLYEPFEYIYMMRSFRISKFLCPRITSLRKAYMRHYRDARVFAKIKMRRP